MLRPAMSIQRGLSLTLVAGLALGATACGGTRTRTPRADKVAEVTSAAPVQGGQGAKTDDVRTADLDGNGVPEVYKYVKEIEDPAKPGEKKAVLVRQDLDVNWDGKVDIWRYFDADGQVSKEEWDTDFDGNIDETRTFDAGVVVQSERDRNNDGKTDIWRFYKAGKLERKESDTNGDGKADRWEYFNGRTVERVGIDRDFDGTVDSWSKAG
jgi:antitoxin component YwqK of YwqJK toxin-antitoxin module